MDHEQESGTAVSDAGQADGQLLDRRSFFKTSTAIAATTALGGLAGTAEAQESATLGMIIDLRKCVGCHACRVACKSENHTPPRVNYCWVTDKEIGIYPDVRHSFISRRCNHCANPTCIPVCPVDATHKRDDGVVVVDYDKCIGCKRCMPACPYGARYFDDGANYHAEPTEFEQKPSPEYAENRPRIEYEPPIGKVRKCTFCLHKLAAGLSPSCAETCMARAIHFGNLADPDARCTLHGERLHDLLRDNSHMRLKEETGNEPMIYYLLA